MRAMSSGPWAFIVSSDAKRGSEVRWGAPRAVKREGAWRGSRIARKSQAPQDVCCEQSERKGESERSERGK